MTIMARSREALGEKPVPVPFIQPARVTPMMSLALASLAFTSS